MHKLLSPKQVARAIGASEASLKRWCDKGILDAVRTAGGHRRIPISSVLQFVRETGQPVVRPEVLGMPATAGHGSGTAERARERVQAALEAGDDEQLRAALMDLYLGGTSACDICDRFLAPTFDQLGMKWEHGALEVYQERRAVEICTRWLHDMHFALPYLPDQAPYAFGATLEGDPYTLPTGMAEMVLREAGWRAESFGIGHPIDTLQAAALDKKPRLVWLSFSAMPTGGEFLRRWNSFYETAAAAGVAVAVGGRGLTEELRSNMSYSCHCDRLSHLVGFATTLFQKA